MNDGKWTVDFNESEIWECDEYFDTKEEAIEYGKELHF